MAEMEDIHRREEEEQHPPPSSDTADLVCGDAKSNHDNNEAEVHNDEGDKDISHVTKSAVNLQQNGGEYELVETIENMTTTTTTTTTTTEENVVVFEGGAFVENIARVEVERLEKRVVFEYVDNGEEEIMLDLDSFEPHAPHCPNCQHRITKLILRRKKPEEKETIFGYCIKCVMFVKTTVFLSIWEKFVITAQSTQGGLLNGLVSIWKPKPRPDQPSTGGTTTIGSTTVIAGGTTTTTGSTTTIAGGTTTTESTTTIAGGTTSTGSTTIIDGGTSTNVIAGDTTTTESTTVIAGDTTTTESTTTIIGGTTTTGSATVIAGDATITESTTTIVGGISTTGGTTVIAGGTNTEVHIKLSFSIGHVNLKEVLKCIVYGGLNESITSLSIIAAVAATDATTLNIFAIGLALLFSSLIAFGIKLADLKNDTDEKYEKLLGGSKSKFVFHVIFVMLSYLVFGLIAPTIFAFAFRESDDKDYKIIAATAAAFACIFILAMAKAHVTQAKDNFRCYIETTRYYLVLAFFSSGVAYAVGYAIEMYVLKFGWFISVQRVTCYPSEIMATAPTWVSY